LLATHPANKADLGAIGNVVESKVWGLISWQKCGLALNAQLIFADGSAKTYYIPVRLLGSMFEAE